MKKPKSFSKISKFLGRMFRRVIGTPDIVGYVERIAGDGIEGWVVHRKGLRPQLKCKIGETVYQVEVKWLERADVAANHGLKHSQCGFHAALVSTDAYALDDAIAANQAIRLFANNVQLPDLSYSSGSDTAILAREKLGLTCDKPGFKVVIESWGHFTVKGSIDGGVDGDLTIELYGNGQPVSRVHLQKWLHKKDQSGADQRFFELEIPGHVWLDLSNDTPCRLELYVNGEACESVKLELTRNKAMTWFADITRMPECREKQYRILLALEHIRYGDYFAGLPAKQVKVLRDFILRMHLEDVFPILDEQQMPAPAKPGLSSLVLWEAMLKLNQRLLDENKPSAVYLHIMDVLKKTKLTGAARRWYINLAVQLTCQSGEFDQLYERMGTTELITLTVEPETTEQYSLALPILVAARKIDRMSDFLFHLSKNVFSGWLHTYCIHFAMKMLLVAEAEGEVDVFAAERCRYGLIALLDGFKGEWFSRLHDLELIDSLIVLLSRLDHYTGYHRRDVTAAAIRAYGLNPLFWERLAAQNIPLQGELLRAREYFGHLEQAIVSATLAEHLDVVVDALVYFRDKHNADAVIMLREISANCLPALNLAWSAQGRALLAELIAVDESEALRIAAFPLEQRNDLQEKFYETTPEYIRELLHKLNAHDKSIVHLLQKSTSTAMVALRQAVTGAQDESVVSACLHDLEQKAMLLNNWQGAFLSLDALATAYVLTQSYDLMRSTLLTHMQSILEKILKDVKPEWFPPASVFSAYTRLKALDDGSDPLLAGFISDAQTMLADKFGKRLAKMLALPDSTLLSVGSSGWPQDTLVVIYSCKAYLDSRVQAIRDTWLADLISRQIPYLILVGDGDDELKGDVLALNVPDSHASLTKKTIRLLEWVYQNTDAQYLVKIEDDCYMDVDNFFDSLSYRKHYYYGRVIRRNVGTMIRVRPADSSMPYLEVDKSPEPSVYADGSGAYVLSRFAIGQLLEKAATYQGERLISCSFNEDKLVGDLLAMSRIMPSAEDYFSFERHKTFPEGTPVAKGENVFFPSASASTAVVHLDAVEGFAVAAQAAAQQELWPKKLWPTTYKLNIGFNSNQLELLNSTAYAASLLQADVYVIAVVRNEMVMLPHFIDYYRALGISTFIFVDNCSTDGTREYLLAQPDVITYSTDTEYNKSHYGVTWQHTLLGNLCLNKWVLLADADELLVYENCESVQIGEYLKTLDEAGAEGALLYMIDMYPYDDLDDACFSKGKPFDVAPYFDKCALRELVFGGGAFSNSINIVNGLRHRLAPTRINAYVSQKYALFKYRPWLRLTEGIHYVANMKVAERPAFFAHFKYHAAFKEKVITEIKRKQHYNGAEEYQKYLGMLAEGKGGFGKEGITTRYENSSTFFGLLSDSVDSA